MQCFAEIRKIPVLFKIKKKTKRKPSSRALITKKPPYLCYVLFQDGLLSQGYGDLINRLHAQIPKVTNDGKRLQMVVCSATLHSFDVKKMAVSGL